MSTEELILVEQFCVYHNVEYSFIRSLEESGLIHIMVKEETAYLPESDLRDAEQYLRLRNELDLTIEGIEVVRHLLDKLKHKEEEITSLQNKLKFYES